MLDRIENKEQIQENFLQQNVKSKRRKDGGTRMVVMTRAITKLQEVLFIRKIMRSLKLIKLSIDLEESISWRESDVEF